MVNTLELRPCLQLQPFVRSFAYRELSTVGCDIERPLFATSDFIISFNLTEVKFLFAKPGDDGLLRLPQSMNSRVVISGIGSQFAGVMSAKDDSRLFSIYFTPTGFLSIFGIPAVHFTNVVEEDVYTCHKGLLDLQEQLMELTDNIEMKSCCEKFLLHRLSRSKIKDRCSSIPEMAGYILHNAWNCSIEDVAYHANMSIKTLERKFTKLVGVSPKLFSRIIRFNSAIALKMSRPHRNWTDIAHYCGYYDQMHFIKDFKHFSGTTPTQFFRHTPPISENLRITK